MSSGLLGERGRDRQLCCRVKSEEGRPWVPGAQRAPVGGQGTGTQERAQRSDSEAESSGRHPGLGAEVLTD